jgi:hypothetical protein
MIREAVRGNSLYVRTSPWAKIPWVIVGSLRVAFIEKMEIIILSLYPKKSLTAFRMQGYNVDE